MAHNSIKFAFAVAAMILTIIFRYSLTYGIEHRSSIIVILSASIYAVALFLSGWFFGKKDRAFLPVYDVGFRFHLIVYLIHNILSELWFVFGFNAKSENVITIHTTAIIWGLFLAGHFIFFLWTRKNAINNLDREDLFD